MDGKTPVQIAENPQFLSEQLLTYLGNKRALLGFLGQGVQTVQQRLGRDKLAVLDLFAGSGIVSRYLRQFASFQIANDLEPYAAAMGHCYLSSPSADLRDELHATHAQLLARLKHEPLRAGLIAELYAPRDDAEILPGERVFYTARNARYLDTARQLIAELSPHLQRYFLGPLLAQASIHANTSGVFKGFYKNAAGVGQFGGHGRDALQRIQKPIALPLPVFSHFAVPASVYQRDANALISQLPPVDLAYLDPPYNQHPYGSNYFMLNLLLRYERPTELSEVSGIPPDWQRSAYNRRRDALPALEHLVRGLNARFLLISFNSEGFITQDAMLTMLRAVGKTELLETQYNTFRGSRNLRGRDKHVREYLFLLEKAPQPAT